MAFGCGIRLPAFGQGKYNNERYLHRNRGNRHLTSTLSPSGQASPESEEDAPLEVALRLAQGAGEILSSHYGHLRRGDADRKSGRRRDLVSIADREAERYLFELIPESDDVLAEEGSERNEGNRRNWVSILLMARSTSSTASRSGACPLRLSTMGSFAPPSCMRRRWGRPLQQSEGKEPP